MRSVSIGQRALTTGVATIAVAGLITATPPTPATPPSQLAKPVSHSAVALTAGVDGWLRLSPGEWISDIALATGGMVAIVVAGPGAAVVGGAAVLWSQRHWIDKEIDAFAALIKKEFPQLDLTRIVDALPRELKEEGAVILNLLLPQRITNLKSLETNLTRLQGRLERRQELTDAQFDKAKMELSRVLGEVAKTLGVDLPPGQVNRWFDQAETGFDNNYDKLEAAVQKFRDQVRTQLNPSPGAQSSARLAASKTSSAKQSAAAPAKTSSTARSARQPSKPTTNRTSKATKSTSPHARSPRAAK